MLPGIVKASLSQYVVRKVVTCGSEVMFSGNSISDSLDNCIGIIDTDSGYIMPIIQTNIVDLFTTYACDAPSAEKVVIEATELVFALPIAAEGLVKTGVTLGAWIGNSVSYYLLGYAETAHDEL